MKKTYLRLSLLSVILAGLTALSFLIFHPPTVGDAFASFESAYQGEFRKIAVLLLAGLVGVAVCLAALVLILSFLREKWLGEWVNKIGGLSGKRKAFLALICLLLLTAFVTGQFSLPAEYVEDPLHRMFLEVARPLFLWICYLSLSSVWILLFLTKSLQKLSRPGFLKPLILFSLLYLLGVGLNLSPYGFRQTSDIHGNFRVPGYPILGYQVLFAFLPALLVFLAERWVKKAGGNRTGNLEYLVDGVLILVLIGGSFFLWRSAPLEWNAFIDIPRPPNHEYYPALDGVLYDRTAQSLLARGQFQSYIDERIYEDLGRRPLLVLYYAILHGIGGLGYEDILPYQLLVFSFFPVLIYIFGKSLHSRVVGFLTAGLLVLRQYNGLLLGSEVTGTNLYMVMSDIQASMGLVLFLILYLKWVREPEKRSILPLLSGGVLAITMLIRSEAVIVWVSVWLPTLWIYRKKVRILLRKGVFLTAGLLIVLIPWVWRNLQMTGKLFLEKPGYDFQMIISILRSTPEGFNNKDANNLFDDDQHAYMDLEWVSVYSSKKMDPVELVNGEYSNLYSDRDFQNRREEESTRSIDLIANHLAGGLIQSVLYLPNTPLGLDIDFLSKMAIGRLDHYYGGVFYHPEKFVRRIPYWLRSWNGKVEARSALLLGASLALVSVGVIKVWDEHRWVTLIPIMALLSYIGIYALIRRSGGRFLMEVDWITAFFYSVGLLELTRVLYMGWCGKEAVEKKEEVKGKPIIQEPGTSWSLWILTPILLFLVGSMPVLAEQWMPNQYPERDKQEKLEMLLNSSMSPFTRSDARFLESFLNNRGEAVYGRSLYPRYFAPDKELMDTKVYYFDASVTFYVLGEDIDYAVLPVSSEPDWFPHGSDVVAFGCPEIPLSMGKEEVCLGCGENGFDALAVVIMKDDGKQIGDTLWRTGDLSDFTGCPLPWPETEE